MKKSCKGCIWFEDCGTDGRCEYYDSPAHETKLALDEYEQYLKEQEEDYEESLSDFED